jgi:hypothetical protein
MSFYQGWQDGNQVIGQKTCQKFIFTKIYRKYFIFFQMKIESSLFKAKETVDNAEIIKKTKDVETIFLNPERKGFLDIFSKEDAAKIKKRRIFFKVRILWRKNFIRGQAA